MSEGACFTMKQILSLGGMVAPNRSTKMVFCRESFHNPDLDKFELSIENKGMLNMIQPASDIQVPVVDLAPIFFGGGRKRRGE